MNRNFKKWNNITLIPRGKEEGILSRGFFRAKPRPHSDSFCWLVDLVLQMSAAVWGEIKRITQHATPFRVTCDEVHGVVTWMGQHWGSNLITKNQCHAVERPTNWLARNWKAQGGWGHVIELVELSLVLALEYSVFQDDYVDAGSL